MNARSWLGIDPSIAAMGWAVMTEDSAHKPYVTGMGVWRTKPDAKAGKFADRARRVDELGRELLELLYVDPVIERVYIEAPIFLKHDGVRTVHASARVRGVVEGICLARGLPLEEFDPKLVKKAITGRIDASKEQVADVVRRLYGVTSKELDATDALAVAHVGASRSGATMKLSSGVVSYREDDEGFADL